MVNYRSNSAAEEIKELLTMDQVARRYGFTPNRAGYICCPFHKEKTASLKIYPGNGGWHCFGCGAGGSVINFVMKLFGLSFPQAVVRLSSDFRLGLTAQRPTKQEASHILEERRRRELERQKAGQEYRAMAAEHQYWWEVQKQFEYPHPLYVEAVKRLPYLEWWLVENLEFGR